MLSILSLGLIIGVPAIHEELLHSIDQRRLKYPAEFREYVAILRETYPGANVLVLPPGTKIEGDLQLDWNEAYKRKKVVAIVARGDLHVTGTIRNTNLDGGPFLFVAGSLRAKRIDKGGAAFAVLGRVEVDDYILCEYNHGGFRVGGDLKCKALFNLDHDVLISGKATGRILSWNDEDLRSELVPEVFNLEDDPNATLPEAELIRKRMNAGLPLLKTQGRSRSE